MQSRYGFAVRPQSDFKLITGRSGCTFREPGTCRVLGSPIERGDNVFNIGPHVGLFTLVMGRALEAFGIVLSIEAFTLQIASSTAYLDIQELQEF